MSRCYRYLLVLVAASLVGVLVYTAFSNKTAQPALLESCRLTGRTAEIYPDYSGIVIPPNIAPLNFLVRENGSHYYVRIYSRQGLQIEVFSRSGKIVICEDSWHELLDANVGEELHFDVFVQEGRKRWSRFDTITNRIASDRIDAFLVYRKIHPTCSAWRRMGVYQRALGGFDESLILDNGYFREGCLNCHSFWNNRTDKMLIAIRSSEYGSSALLVEDGVVNKIGTKFGYTSWHPSGRLAAYSVNQVGQFFHSGTSEVRDVIDLNSLLAYYLVDVGEVRTSPEISRKDRLESYPTWSPDGRYLYFCSAPLWWSAYNVVPQRYNEIKYDLVRISYALEEDQWGTLETMLSAQDTGLSIVLPRVSPDGRWLLFCMCDYGCFPVYRSSSDLYIMDLGAVREDGRYEYRRLNVNSDQSESWHSWSSNSRWIAFSSKKGNGLFTRLYLAYVDRQGQVCKPLLLPQKDPTYYDSCLWTYSVPELVTGPVKFRKERLGRAVRGSRRISAELPITMATPKAGTLPAHDEPWLPAR